MADELVGLTKLAGVVTEPFAMSVKDFMRTDWQSVRTVQRP
jgi:hypothetical protein